MIIKLENFNKGLCVMCDKKIENQQVLICRNCLKSCNNDTQKSDCCNSDVEYVGRKTCSESCHNEFIDICENLFGKDKMVIDEVTNIVYRVPTRDIIEKGLKQENLGTYPIWID